MSGWIDPLGVHSLRRMIAREIDHLHEAIRLTLADQRQCRIGEERRRRRVAKYRARLYQLRRLDGDLNRLERPGVELLSHKDLVQGGDVERRRRLSARVAQGVSA
jgi:hypothetical protein